MAQLFAILLALLLAAAAAICFGTGHPNAGITWLLLAFIMGASATTTPPRQS